MTLYLAERWWWLSHYNYWSVCVGLLYTVIDSLQSFSGFIMVSRKGMAPFSLLFSTVNCIGGSTLLMCCRKYCLFSSFWITKVSSTYQHHSLEDGKQYLEPFAQSSPYMGVTGEPMATPLNCS